MELTHYTSKPSGVANILAQRGFAYTVTPRRLIEKFLPNHDFSAREPQSFGMVSFTELPPAEAAVPRDLFGDYGIVVTENWARRNQAQRVMYIEDDGPVFDALKDLFTQCIGQVRREMERYPTDAARRMALTNKAMAGVVGSSLYANLLTLYEYMEPGAHSGEREWRVVNPYPLYSLSQDTEEAIAAVSPAEGWNTVLNLVKFEISDVQRIHCPQGEVDALRILLQPEWQNLPIGACHP